mmetsp:Transcript_61132/g.157652  ORF Transcript_61132/g.157652 Transcript_61132/m.157652 type:complete len:940 (+) Transcript_61132:52-2871(+)
MPGATRDVSSHFASDEETESDDNDCDTHMNIHKGHATIAMVAAVAVGALCMFGLASTVMKGSPEVASGGNTATLGTLGTMGMGNANDGPSFDPSAMDKESESERGTCTNVTQKFHWISNRDPYAQKAVVQAFKLGNLMRQNCTGGGPMPPIPFNPEKFFQGDEHRHVVHVYHKFSGSCSSETYMLRFHVAGVSSSYTSNGLTDSEGAEEHAGKLAYASLQTTNVSTSFLIEINHNLESGAWKVLHSQPSPCDIQLGLALAPHAMPTSHEHVQKIADFIAVELVNQMREAGCYPTEGSSNWTKINRAVVSVVEGMAWQISLDLQTPGNQPRPLDIGVLEQCNIGPKCVRQLLVSNGDPCGVFEAPQPDFRILQERMPGGAPSDPTEMHEARMNWLLYPERRLQAERPPITVRHIRTGDVPHTYDPVPNECFQKVIVYNQGSCADCYAAATAVMIGVRKCMLDKGLETHWANNRRLSEKEPEDVAAVPSLRSSAKAKEAVTAVDDAMDVNERRLQQQLPSTASHDSTTWEFYQNGQAYGCSWYALNDPGCTKYPDHGQRSNCQVTCHTQAVLRYASLNPWNGADYTYMTSTTDVAQCAKDSSDEIRGCNGGSPSEIWNNWMRKLGRALWLQEEKCMPYNLKCNLNRNQTGLVKKWNCPLFATYQMWQKPCECIDEEDYPQANALTCNNTEPPPGCGIDVPNAWFEVKSVAQGLPIPDAVLNMQRHIYEFGPIFVSVQQTLEFTNWDYNKDPVYTGGKTVVGAHALIAAGWGTFVYTDYWIIRNSWSPRWADRGYCKFQRGKNLDGIEEIGVDAAMPTNNFADWSEPVCEMSYMRWNWWILNDGTITNYTGFVDVVCDKAASLEVFFSARMDSHNTPVTTDGGMTRHGSAQGNGVKTTFTVNLLGQGFGYQPGDLLISIDAEDPQGNKGNSKTSMRIPPAGG